MTIPRLTSFWEDIANALSRGVDTYSATRENELTRRLREAAELRAQEQHASAQKLAALQAAPLELRQQILAAEANPAMVAQPSGFFGTSVERFAPVPGKLFSESQYETANLRSPRRRQREETAEGTKLLESQLGIQRTEQQLALGKEETSPEAVTMRSLARLSDFVDKSAAGYIDEEINKVGGLRALIKTTKDKSGKATSPDEKARRVGEAAYENFVTKSQLINLTEPQQRLVKARMESALLDRQIQAMEADARLTAAYRERVGMDPARGITDDLRDRLIRIDSDRTRLQAEENALGPSAQGARIYLNRHEKDVPEVFRDAWAKLRAIENRRLQLEEETVNIKRAQAEVARGNLNIGHLMLPVTGQPDASGTQAPAAGGPKKDWRSIVQPSRP